MSLVLLTDIIIIIFLLPKNQLINIFSCIIYTLLCTIIYYIIYKGSYGSPYSLIPFLPSSIRWYIYIKKKIINKLYGVILFIVFNLLFLFKTRKETTNYKTRAQEIAKRNNNTNPQSFKAHSNWPTHPPTYYLVKFAGHPSSVHLFKSYSSQIF